MTLRPLTADEAAAATTPLAMPREIATARLRLTAWRLDHFARLAEMHGDPATMRFMGGHMDAPTAWRGMAAMSGQWVLRGYGIYAVEDAAGRLVGRCGLFHPLDWPERELGYAFHADARGKGYATEVVTAVRDAAIGQGVSRLISLISPHNAPSLRIAEKLGATPTDEGEVEDGYVIRFVHNMQPASSEPPETPPASGEPPETPPASSGPTESRPAQGGPSKTRAKRVRTTPNQPNQKD